MRKNIFAYTNGAQVPGYISVNEEADDRVTVTLRSIGAYLEAPAAPETKAKK